MAPKKEVSKVKVLPIIKFYLIIYNLLCFYGWLTVLYQTVDYLLIHDGDYLGVYPKIYQLLQVVQTAALLEIVHATIGIVKSAPLTTMMQVASRLYIVWYILFSYDKPEVHTSFYVTSMVIAWSITEIIRYSFYALSLLLSAAPKVSVWMRYNFFFILYPVGAFSEFMLIQKARVFEDRLYVVIAMTVISGIYAPGFYYMYSHMISQRSKVMAKSNGDKKKN